MRYLATRLFIILCTAFLPHVLCAQEKEWQELQGLKDDSAKVDRILDYGDQVANRDQKGAEPVYLAGLRLSEKLGYRWGIAYSWMKLGYVEALRANYRTAINHFNTSAGLFMKLGKKPAICRVLTNIGAIYEIMGKPDSAMVHYMKSASILEDSRDSVNLANTYCSIGIVYGNTKVYDKALWYKTRAVEIGRRVNDSLLLIEALSELADTYGEMGQPAKGLPLAKEALGMARTRAQSNELTGTHYSLAALYVGLKQADAAVDHAKECIRYAQLCGDMNTYLGGARALSEAYDLQGKQVKRMEVLKEALAQSKKSGALILADDLSRQAADAAYKLGDYKTAYRYFNDYTVYRDSVLNEKNNRTVSELEIRYQTAQKEKALSQNQLQLVQKDLQLQKSRYYMYYTIGALVLSLLLVGLLFLKARYKKAVHARELEAVQRQKELQLLQAIMQGEEKERGRIAKDLHDGVAGMLAAVKMHFSSMEPAGPSVLESEGYRQGMRLLNEAAQEIRKTSHNLMPEVLLQHGLDAAMRRYCNSVNNSRGLQIQYDSWGEIDRFAAGFELSVYRIVQELVNNIIKHSRATQAIVQLTQQAELLTISIEDNGIGFLRSSPSDGMGLRSLEARVQAMNGKLEMQEAEECGVSAYLEFEITGVKKEKEKSYATGTPGNY